MYEICKVLCYARLVARNRIPTPEANRNGNHQLVAMASGIRVQTGHAQWKIDVARHEYGCYSTGRNRIPRCTATTRHHLSRPLHLRGRERLGASSVHTICTSLYLGTSTACTAAAT
ncbi:hypothetical protein F511_14847 [Dorcoceras hygrometricum]|uniref:Uncharacterized protein n=1 Tax=Dorcoceras hygrometricum TaxID=472368 RepID=A0A2Z7D9D4_9LAMI|nr:hypothetical protein F511_14847 [Dorcoceras hygrometricum]